MLKKHGKKFILLLLAILVVTSGFGCKWTPKKQSQLQPITLEYWGVWDTSEQVAPLIKAYQDRHPTIKVNYRNFRYEEYETELLEAWADDRGPDIFAIPASWLKEYQHRLEPMPQSVTIPILEMQGTIKQEAVTVLTDIKGLSPQDVKDRYVPVVYDNVVLDNQVYGLPFYLDTLVTFYNEDLLTQSSIPEPIKNFHELIDQAPMLTKALTDNTIYQSAVSLGGTANIPRFFDVFSSLMLQNEVNVKGNYFDPLQDKDSAQNLAEAFSFYTNFSRPGLASYSWSPELDNAFEMFASGRLAYFFGYSYHADELKKRGLQFDWNIINFPQLLGSEGTKYYADYWVNVVPKKSKNKDAAWNFVHSGASEAGVKEYLNQNKRATALRSLINEQLSNPDLKIFASQVLTADNWYKGYNQPLAEQYTAEIIDKLESGELILDTGGTTLGLFVSRINQTYAKPD